MSPDSTQAWYAALQKPFFAPPAWIFGPVWTVLYLIILVSFGYVFWRVAKREWPFAVAVPFLVNIAANLAFSPIQFSLRSNLLALIDILIVLGSILWMLRVIRPLAPWVGWAQVPYLLWVGFATILQTSITWLNW